MTRPALSPASLLPLPNARGPLRYRVSTSKSASYATERIIGMWVPAAALRKGTRIIADGYSATASAQIGLQMGGDGTIVAHGTTGLWTASGAAANYFRFFATVEIDGLVSTITGNGAWQALQATFATTNFLVQPLNYISLRTAGTFTIDSCTLEVVPPERTIWAVGQEYLVLP